MPRPLAPRHARAPLSLAIAVFALLLVILVLVFNSISLPPVPIIGSPSTFGLPLHPVKYSDNKFTHSYLLDHLNTTDGLWKLYPRDAVNSSPLCSNPDGCEWIPHGEEGYGAIPVDVALTLSSSDPLVLFPNGSQLSRLVAVPSPLEEFVSPLACWRASNTSILFLGHSHVRYMASLLCMMLRGRNCNEIGSKNTKAAIMDDGLGDHGRTRRPIIAFVQSSYYPKRRIPILKKVLRRWGIHDDKQFGHIVYARGSWDMSYRDVDPLNLTLSVVEALETYAHHFGKCKVTADGDGGGACKEDVQLTIVPTHRHHLWGSYTKPKVWADHVQVCKSVERQWLYHETARCAASLIMGTDTTIPTHHSPPHSPSAQQQIVRATNMGVFDVWDQTSSSFGRATVDFAGHHYLDITLEGLVQMFLSQHVCPASGHPPQPTIPPSACRAVLKASKVFTPLSLCSCHSDGFRLKEPCTSLRPYIGGRRD